MRPAPRTHGPTTADGDLVTRALAAHHNLLMAAGWPWADIRAAHDAARRLRSGTSTGADRAILEKLVDELERNGL